MTPEAQNERALLGCILYDPATGLDSAITHGITPHSFGLEAHRAIYTAILKMWKETGMCEPYSLQRAVTLDGVQDGNIIQSIADECLTVAYAPFYAEKVRDQEKRRALRRIANRMLAADEDTDVNESIATAETSLTQLYGTAVSKQTLSEVATHACKTWDATADGISTKGIPSRYKKLTQLIGGYSEYTILAARPSQGKSLLMLNEALTMSIAGQHVGIASVEMTTKQCLVRMACDMADLNNYSLEHGYATTEQRMRAKDCIHKIAATNLHIEDMCATVDEICTWLRMTHIRHSLDIAFVDYLQLIRGNKKYANGNERVQDISAQLLHLRKRLGIPIVVLSQLSRECERENRLPRLSDLRDSGAIEQDGHTILLLSSNPEAADRESILQIAKNRDGPTAKITLQKNFQRQRFEE